MCIRTIEELESYNPMKIIKSPKEILDILYENNNFTSANTEEDEIDLDM